jgi:hypothetical protein
LVDQAGLLVARAWDQFSLSEFFSSENSLEKHPFQNERGFYFQLIFMTRGTPANHENRYSPLPLAGEGVKKSVRFFFTSFRRKPESSVFKALAIAWTPVFTGVTA